MSVITRSELPPIDAFQSGCRAADGTPLDPSISLIRNVTVPVSGAHGAEPRNVNAAP
jgi:hypothetical protein